jgi:hypothetical protein
MNAFDQKQPEENDPEYEELMTLLHHANLDAMFVDPQDQAHAVSQVRARLFPPDHEVAQTDAHEMQELGSLPSEPKARRAKHRRRLIHLLNAIAATLVVTLLIGSAMFLFGPPLQSAQAPLTTKTVLIRIDTGPILPGQAIVLHGEGFSPHGLVSILFDGSPVLFDQSRQLTSSLIIADTQGAFTISIVFDSLHLVWRAGPHVVSAEDVTTKRVATLHIILSTAPINKGVPSPPVPAYPPNATPPGLTPIPSVTGGQPTPIGQTPIPVTPTPRPVTPTPTVGTPPTSTPTVSPTAGTKVGSGPGNASDFYLDRQLTHLSPWVWLMIACCCLAMVLIGFAGVLGVALISGKVNG